MRTNSELLEICRLSEAVTAGLSGRSLPDLRQQRPGRMTPARIRHVAIYLAHVEAQVPTGDLARAFGRDPATIRYACARIEDARDNPLLDRALDCLGAALGAQVRAFGLASKGAAQ